MKDTDTTAADVFNTIGDTLVIASFAGARINQIRSAVFRIQYIQLTGSGLQLTGSGIRLTGFGIQLTGSGIRLTGFGIRLPDPVYS